MIGCWVRGFWQRCRPIGPRLDWVCFEVRWEYRMCLLRVNPRWDQMRWYWTSWLRSDKMKLDELWRDQMSFVSFRLRVCLCRRALKRMSWRKKTEVFLVLLKRRKSRKKKTVHRGDQRKNWEIFSSSRLYIKISPSGAKKPLESRRLPAWIAGSSARSIMMSTIKVNDTAKPVHHPRSTTTTTTTTTTSPTTMTICRPCCTYGWCKRYYHFVHWISMMLIRTYSDC